MIYEGKTKRITKVGDRLVLQFKDTLTGRPDGKVDPGGDRVVGSLQGKGEATAKVAAFFFKLLEEAGLKTHFLGVRSSRGLEILPAERIPLEVIYRSKAYGSFLERYRGHINPLAPLDLIELTLKDDSLGDPLLTPSAAIKLGLLKESELEQIESLTKKAARVVKQTLAKKGLELVDMKLEFGRAGGDLVLVDELSGDTMRVYDPRSNKLLNQLELASRLLH